MSEHYYPGGRGGRCVAGASMVAAVAVSLWSTPVAHAAAFPLPDGLKDAPGVTITRTGETANVLPSLARNGAARSVYVSGNVTVDMTREIPEATQAASQLNTGYIFGCTVSIGDDSISAGAAPQIGLNSGVGISGTAGLDIAPGEVKFVQINAKDIPEPGLYAIEYQDVEIDIQGCAGRAQARAYTTVEIIANDYAQYSLYGQPFDVP